MHVRRKMYTRKIIVRRVKVTVKGKLSKIKLKPSMSHLSWASGPDGAYVCFPKLTFNRSSLLELPKEMESCLDKVLKRSYVTTQKA